MMNRLKRPVGYCRRLTPEDAGYQDGVELFAPPEIRWLNLLPISGELMLVSGGSLNTQFLKAKLPAWMPEVYQEGDRCYVHKEAPAEFAPEEPGCDYVVRSVLQGHSVTELMLEKMVSE